VASFADALPADVLLLCGIFGNISDRDIERTVQAAAALCRPGATVIWTRHRRPPDLTPKVRAWFTGSGFEEVAFDALEESVMIGVGAARLVRAPAAGPPDSRLFTFRADHGGRPRSDPGRIDSVPADHETVGPNGGQEA
jgi:hypothetical protein